mgnify:CR=1 FL=1
MLKSLGVVVVVVDGLQHFSVSLRPLGFGFGTIGFGAMGLIINNLLYCQDRTYLSFNINNLH